MLEHIPLIDWLPTFPVFFLYAEIHYKILKLPSRLFKRWPEIIADVPYRIEPGKRIPILIIVKDANRFPVQIKNVWIEIRNSEHEFKKIEILNDPIFIDSNWWDNITEIENPFEGNIWIDVFITAKKKNKSKIVKNNNYNGSSHSPFRIFAATEKLPTFPNQYYGDLHCHSNYTSDQVEFGASLNTIKTVSKAEGLSFVAVTDHSYDLDDQPNNYLKKDPTLQKWKKFQREVKKLNRDQKGEHVFLIPGEEVSVANHLGRNVHFLVLNSPTFYEGYGDSAEKWFYTRAKWNIKKLLDDLPIEALAIFPHPFISIPTLEYIFLRRGNIKKQDYQYNRINGLQILNGSKNPAFFRGLEHWKKQLLKGRRLFIYAGNDSHGNFNYYRQVKLPHWSLIEKDTYIFGKAKTVIITNRKLGLSTIIEALRTGRCYITDGPALNIKAIDDKKNSFHIGEDVHSTHCQFNVSVLSTSEFGNIENIIIFLGSQIEKRETIYKTIQPENKFTYNGNFSFKIKGKDYLRIEVETKKGDKTYNAYSNPIWIQSTNIQDF